MIWLILAAGQPALIESVHPLDRTVIVDEDSIQKHSLRELTYVCELKNESGDEFQIEFARTGGAAFLTRDERIPIGRKPSSVAVTKNTSPFPLSHPTNVYASTVQTNLTYDNPGYVPMTLVAINSGDAWLSFQPGTTDSDGNPHVYEALRGKCAVRPVLEKSHVSAELVK